MLKHSFAFLLAAFAFTGFGAPAPKPLVLVSIPPQAWIAERLLGSNAEIRCILPVGANPHTFEPDARALVQIANAKVLLTIGMPFERRFTERLRKNNPSLRIAATDAGIAKLADGCGDPREEGDPHIWLSPKRFATVARNSAEALDSALPAERAAIDAHLAGLLAELRAIDAELARRLASAPCKTWVVCHPSWTYFAADYGFTLLTVEEEGKAPSARQLVAIIKAARAAKASAVYTEPRLDPRQAATLAAGFGGRVVVLDPLEQDWPALMRKVADELCK